MQREKKKVIKPHQVGATPTTPSPHKVCARAVGARVEQEGRFVPGRAHCWALGGHPLCVDFPFKHSH